MVSSAFDVNNRQKLLQRMASVDQFSLLFRIINQNFKTCEDILAIIGLLYVSKLGLSLTWNVLQGFRVHVLSRFGKGHDFKKYGKWAVVTGGTDGIGRAYARELARRKLNIIIISRNMEKMETTAKEIEQEFKVDTFLIQADFSLGKEIYSDIAEKLKDKEIGVLINNVGVMYDHPSYFMDVPEKKIWDLININIAGVTMMTYIVIPQMVARRKGVIVNISSISSFYPLPLMTAYSASKAFVDWFSRALEYEYKDQGIVVQSLVPSYIATKLVRFSSFLQQPSLIVPDAERFVKSAVRTIGVSNRTTGFWTHGLQYFAYDHFPERIWYISSWYMQKIIDNHESRETEKEKGE